jgi:uncharacterized protein YlxW (UPF0749 family)
MTDDDPDRTQVVHSGAPIARARSTRDEDATMVLRGPSRRKRGTAGTVTIAMLLSLLGFALVVQFKSRNSDAELSAARPEDLVRILSDLDAQQTRLQAEIGDLENTKRQLDSGAQGQQAALDDARRRADVLGILAGTLPAEGPGLEIDVTSASAEPVGAALVLDAVEELRGAGAEALQIAGSGGTAGSGPVRIVASTYFADDNDRLKVDGVSLGGPWHLVVIGDPQTMVTALNIPGGVVDSVRQHGGTVSVRQAETVHVTALHTAGRLQYAKPVS